MAQQNMSSADNKPLSRLELRTSNLSPAELYINQQSQMVLSPNNTQPGSSSISNSTSSIRHAEKMQEWRDEQINEVYKHEPCRYKYGTPPSNHSTFRRVNNQTNAYSSQSSSINDKVKK